MNATQTVSATTNVNTEQMPSAWVLKVTENLQVAVSQYEMHHIEESSQLIKIPCSPAWCNNLLLWKSQIVPVIDFTKWQKSIDAEPSSQQDTRMIAIIRYKNPQTATTSYGAIRIEQPPVLEKVSNQQSCQADDLSNDLRAISVSAFRNSDKATVPVLNVSKLFSGAITG